MLAIFILGLLLGWGAAIPLGPVNLEIMRRNLSFGWLAGFSLGLGACTADLIYLLILSLGFLPLLNYPKILAVLGIAGSLILGWFAYGAFRLSTKNGATKATNAKSPGRSFTEGLAMTLINPFTVLFWVSVGAQVATLSNTSYHIFIAALGVIVGTLSWIFAYNTILHLTRHKFTENTKRILNRLAALVLVGFAVYGFIHAIYRFN